MKQEFSAGGIVLKKESGQLYVLMVQHGLYHSWGFPKGHVGDTIPDETEEEAAIREVKEETGIEAEILEKAEIETYTYNLNGESRIKSVQYFIMRYKSGNFAGKDREMEAVEWVKLEDVHERLTYDNAKEMFLKQLPKLESISEMLS